MKLRMACNKLRIDPNDGSPVLEYRIEDGRVERRTVEAPVPESTAIEAEWKELTPEQLASQLMAHIVVARWLNRRLGIFSVLPAAGQLPYVDYDGQEPRCQERKVTIGEFTPLLSR